MSLRRLRPPDVLTGLAGAALLALLWAPWYSTAGAGLNAWSAFAAVDLWLALTALLAIAVPVVTAARDTTPLPVAVDVVSGTVAAFAVLLVAIRLLVRPGGDAVTGLDWGAVAGAVAVLGACAGSWWALRDES